MDLAWHSDPELTLNVYAHARLEELGRVMDSLPTTKLWASDSQCDFAQILATGGVSEGRDTEVEMRAELRPRVTRQASYYSFDQLTRAGFTRS